jgi:hypothetical protein
MMMDINTTKKENVTIKNFGQNKKAAINYYNNVKNKGYVNVIAYGFIVTQKGWCVKIIYK